MARNWAGLRGIMVGQSRVRRATVKDPQRVCRQAPCIRLIGRPILGALSACKFDEGDPPRPDLSRVGRTLTGAVYGVPSHPQARMLMCVFLPCIHRLARERLSVPNSHFRGWTLGFSTFPTPSSRLLCLLCRLSTKKKKNNRQAR